VVVNLASLTAFDGGFFAGVLLLELPAAPVLPGLVDDLAFALGAAFADAFAGALGAALAAGFVVALVPGFLDVVVFFATAAPPPRWTRKERTHGAGP
jgi:hypothetical protein